MGRIYTDGHVAIRSIGRQDTENIVRWRNQPAVRENLYTNQPITAENHEYWLTNYVDTGKCDQFIIEAQLPPTPEMLPVGSVFLKNIEPHKAEFGIFLSEEAQGKGVGTAATRMILAHGFRALELDRIYLTVFSHNPAAIRAYEKAGFVIEGVARKDFWRGDVAMDVVNMAILREEWMGSNE